MNALTALLAIVRDLCRFRSGPQELPFAPRLLVGVLVLSVAVDLAIGTAVGVPGNLLARSAFSIALLLGGSYALLSAQGHAARLIQTVMALVAVSIVFTLMLLPLLQIMGDPPVAEAKLAPRQVLVGWLVVALLAWKLAVDAHIWRHALQIPFGAGVLLAITWFVVETMLSRWLFGVQP